jgi:hypothetical protein
MNKPTEGGFSEHQATCASSNAKNQTFHYLFSDETGPASTESGSYGGLSAPRCCAGDEKVRDVEAGDQQQTSGGGEHGVEAGFKMKDLCIKDRSNVGCVEDWSIWKLLPYLPLDCLQLCRRLPDRDLELEPGDRVKVVSGVQTHDLRGSFVIDRCPQLDLAVRVVEPLGKNAKDCVKSATLVPMPRLMTRIARIEKPGLRARPRIANRRSRSNS